MTAPAQIYVRLLHEAVDVWRPVMAEHLGGGVYRIADQPYDPEVETWEFPPGARVASEEIDVSGGRVLAAAALPGGG